MRLYAVWYRVRRWVAEAILSLAMTRSSAVWTRYSEVKIGLQTPQKRAETIGEKFSKKRFISNRDEAGKKYRNKAGTRDASALRWRPERGTALFRRGIGFLRLSHPRLVCILFSAPSILEMKFIQKLFPLVYCKLFPCPRLLVYSTILWCISCYFFLQIVEHLEDIV